MTRINTVVITRPEDQAEEFNQLLKQENINTIVFPLIDIVPLDWTDQTLKVLYDLYHGCYQWLVISSANGARVLSLMLREQRLPMPKGLKIAAQGQASKKAVERTFGVQVTHCPNKAVSENFAESLIPLLSKDERVLVLTASASRGVMYRELTKGGFLVDQLACYESRPVKSASRLLTKLNESSGTAVTFFSPSAWKVYLDLINKDQSLSTHSFASIGPVTTAAIESDGYSVDFEASDQSSEAMLAALLESR